MSDLLASAIKFVTRMSQTHTQTHTHTQTIIYIFKQPVPFIDIMYFIQGLFEINPYILSLMRRGGVWGV